jgi:signal transduction histidine kinase
MMTIMRGLATRTAVILLVGLVLVQGLLAFAMLSGSGARPLEYALPLPRQIVAIVDALEQLPASERARVLTALNSPVMNVTVLPDFPALQPAERPARLMRQLFLSYSEVLQNRELRIYTKKLRGNFFRPQQDRTGALRSLRPLRLQVRLRDGSVLQIVPTRRAALATTAARVAGFAALVGLVVITMLLVAIRRTTQPVAALARSARRFATDFDAPDMPVSGPREVRDLAIAFNEMQHTIRELVHERTRMLAAVAHDMRTYLTRLQLRTDFISSPEQRMRAAKDLEEMAELIDQTLVFARETARAPGEDSAPPSAAADVNAIMQQVCAAKAATGAAVSWQADAATEVRCSATALTRILGNLIDNAVRYGHSAHVTWAVTASHCTLRIEDEGPGIPPEQIPRLLRPFERLEESRGRTTGGTGLGLAIVHALVQKAGGTLELQNRPAGGLACLVTLPRSLSPPSL